MVDDNIQDIVSSSVASREVLERSFFLDSVTHIPIDFRSLSKGNRYSFVHLFENFSSADGNRYIYAELPESTDNPVSVGFRQITTDGNLKGSVYTGVTEDTAGTDSKAANGKVSPDSVPESNVNWRVGGQYSGLSEGQPFFIPGGESQGTRVGATGSGAHGYFEPGTNVLWVFNSLSDNNRVLFKAVYTEGSVLQV